MVSSQTWRSNGRPAVGGGEACRRAFKSRVLGVGNGVIAESPDPLSTYGMNSLRSRYEAPTDGYEPSCDFGNHTPGGKIVAYLKIRTGQPGGPLFGKLLDALLYTMEGDADEFRFEYVINPSGGRGLEMDMNHLIVPARHELEYAPEEF